MAIDKAILAFHEAQCAVAAALYVSNKQPQAQARFWAAACRSARVSVEDLLSQSNELLALEAALVQNAGHLFVLLRMLAPPPEPRPIQAGLFRVQQGG